MGFVAVKNGLKRSRLLRKVSCKVLYVRVT